MATYECQRCHRAFQRISNEEVCPVCSPLDEEDFRKIREYLSEHQGASSSEVVQRLGVTLAQIKRYLKEERLEIVGDIKGFIKCEKCGKPISSGRLCDYCYKEARFSSKKEIGYLNRNPSRNANDTEKQDKHKYLKEISYKEKNDRKD